MSILKTNARYLLIIAGLILVGVSAYLRAAAGLLQGSYGTPSGTAPPFSIEPISLVIGIAAGGLAVGIPALAYAAKEKKKSPPVRDRPDQDCDGISGEARRKHKGWDGTIKGVKRGDDVSSAVKGKKQPGRESPTLASKAPAPEATGSSDLINPIAMDKGLRIDQSNSAPGEESLVKVGEPSEKKHTKTGHVTLMK